MRARVIERVADVKIWRVSRPQDPVNPDAHHQEKGCQPLAAYADSQFLLSCGTPSEHKVRSPLARWRKGVHNAHC